MSFKRFHDVEDGSKPQAETRLQIPNHSPEAHPKPTLLAQGARMIWEDTRWWEKVLIFFLLLLMLVIPLITNWMNVQMVQGSAQSFAILFCIVRIFERPIDVLRDSFLLQIATRMQELFVKRGIKHYFILSQQTKQSNPAYNFVKFLKDAGWSINHLIEWGLFAIGSMVGQIISAGVLLFVFDLQIVDYVILPIAIAIAAFVIRKLQKLLTDRQQKSRDLEEKNTDIEQLKAMKLQNGDITADEILEFLLKPILYDNCSVRPLYNYIGCTLDITLELVALAYAIYLPNDRAFVAKLVLIRTISSALNSVTHFMSQYNRYCNQYLQHRKHYEAPLQYDEHHEQLPIPEEGLQIKSVSIPRGENYSIKGGRIPINPGTHKLVRGPSGAGKTSLVDALRGFNPGVTLDQGSPANYSHQIWMHAQSCASLVQTYSISIADLFETNNTAVFPHIHDLLLVVFEEPELRRILVNISKENPFQTKIQGKISGGQKERFFIALSLWEMEKKKSRIAIFDEVGSALDPENRVEVLRNLYTRLKAHNIAAIWITHICQCELDKCGIKFDGKLHLVPRKDGTGADILQSE